MHHPPPPCPEPPAEGSRRTWLQRRLGAPLAGWALTSLGPTLALTGGCALRPGAPTPEASEAEPPPAAPAPEPVAMDHPPQFSNADPGPWPEGWFPYVLRRDLPRTRYEVVRDGNRQVLRARARRSATGLHCSLKPTPAQQLRFSWKVARTPDQASVDVAERDDCPARVVVAFDGDHRRLPLRDRLLFDQVELFTGQRLPYAMLMYVWGGRGNPLESLHRNHRTARIQYLTVESGDARVGQWLHYERHLGRDFRRAFGEPPGPVIGVGVLTDADALKTELEAWYGDIALRPGPAA